MDLGEYEAAGLYDPYAPDAEDRAELIAYLVEIGCTIEEMVAADAHGRLFALGGDRIIVPGRDQFSLADVTAETGASIGDVRAVWRALGFVEAADEVPVASPEDLEAIRTVINLSALVGLPAALGVGRVVASSMARVADAISAAVRTSSPQLSLGFSGSEAVTARTFTGVAGAVPRVGQALDAVFRHHLEAARRHWERSDSADLLDVGGVRLGVGFADLSGFTGMTENLTMAELSSLLTVFEEVADSIVRAEDGRVVKYIGDAVMYVAHDAAAAVRIAQSLLASAEMRGMQARAGVTVGVVLALEGDYFGPVVNLAARLVSMAGPGEVLVTDEVLARLEEKVEAVTLGPRVVRGFSNAIEVARLR
ncbi:MAG TPA: adenylate/guanylate cyclase domain-containing protein [Mycobacteriales bacterium]|nr:adenylate/guanylate cyclase domain-containing protein [Mycobacteriales bacterium]